MKIIKAKFDKQKKYGKGNKYKNRDFKKGNDIR